VRIVRTASPQEPQEETAPMTVFASLRSPGYCWTDSPPRLDDLDALTDAGEATRASKETALDDVTQTCRVSRADFEDGGVAGGAWSERAAALEGRVAMLVEVVASTRRQRDASHAVIALRRLGGCFGAVVDTLCVAIDDAATARSPSARRYLESAWWCTTALVHALEQALRHASDRDRAIFAAADFAALYACGHLEPLRDACGDEAPANGADEAIATLVEGAHRELIWLVTTLREELAPE
jgi:hypothetical protein